MPKYMRIQGREIAFKTGKPAGLFALCWRRIRDGIFSAEDEAAFRAEDEWFRANLPIPPFYEDDFKGEVTPITWFKIDCPEEMRKHTAVITGLLDKYNVRYDIVHSDYVGRIIYEDDFQIGTVDSEITIRQIAKDELPSVLDLIHKSFATVAANMGFTKENCPGHTSFMPMEKLQNYYEWGFLMYGLFEDDKMVGYVSLAKQPEGHYDLNNLAVLPEKRHCAYGGRLVDFCKQKVKELGADKIRIGIIEESWIIKNFYEYHGFVHTGTEKFDHLPFTVGRMEWTVK